MRKLSSLLLTTACLTSFGLQPALAEGWREHGDIHRFHEHDYDHWRGGRWFFGSHERRDGWWWIVDGLWYLYPSPVYPYPDPYTPPAVAVVTAPAPIVAAPNSVYYCSNPAGYYPYVSQCYGRWSQVVTSAAPGTTVVVQGQQAPSVAPAAPQATPELPVAPHSVAATHSKGEESDRHELNTLTTEFQNIDLTGQRAQIRLGELQQKIEAFRSSLYKRSYNAMEVLKHTEELAHRVAEEKEALGRHQGMPALPPQ